jgi:hypothetical protein
MRTRTVLITLAQGVVVGVLGLALSQAVETAPVQPSATPTPCEVNRIDVAHPERSQMLTCSAADATATAYIMAVVTVTPCDPWDDKNLTPTGSNPLVAPCGVVAHDATWAAYGATQTAGIIDGSNYGLHYSNAAPNWTPTIFAYGTVPPDVLAGYPATLTAMPQETPYGWHLDGDHWVADGGRRP